MEALTGPLCLVEVGGTGAAGGNTMGTDGPETLAGSSGAFGSSMSGGCATVVYNFVQKGLPIPPSYSAKAVEQINEIKRFNDEYDGRLLTFFSLEDNGNVDLSAVLLKARRSSGCGDSSPPRWQGRRRATAWAPSSGRCGGRYGGSRPRPGTRACGKC